ncbi:MAG: CopG family transcriptional regulator [Alphaproteobacteria bacterium]
MKFSSKMAVEVLEGLKAHAAREGRTLSAVLTTAAEQYLQRATLRPAYRRAAKEVLDEHAELLERLAR